VQAREPMPVASHSRGLLHDRVGKWAFVAVALCS
jgi:hypothetical protein